MSLASVTRLSSSVFIIPLLLVAHDRVSYICIAFVIAQIVAGKTMGSLSVWDGDGLSEFPEGLCVVYRGEDLGIVVLLCCPEFSRAPCAQQGII